MATPTFNWHFTIVMPGTSPPRPRRCTTPIPQRHTHERHPRRPSPASGRRVPRVRFGDAVVIPDKQHGLEAAGSTVHAYEPSPLERRSALRESPLKTVSPDASSEPRSSDTLVDGHERRIERPEESVTSREASESRAPASNTTHEEPELTPTPPPRGSTEEEDNGPPKPPEEMTLYGDQGRTHVFSRAGKKWLEDTWCWMIREGIRENKQPGIFTASRRMFEISQDAGLDLANVHSFYRYRSYKDNAARMEAMKTAILGAPWGQKRATSRIEKRHAPQPSEGTHKKARFDRPEQDKTPTHSPKQPRARQEDHGFDLTKEEVRAMVFKVGDVVQHKESMSIVWAYMQKQFPRRGFGVEDWQSAYHHNMALIDRRVRESIGGSG